MSKRLFVSQIWIGGDCSRKLVDCKRWRGQDPHNIEVEAVVGGVKKPAPFNVLIITRPGKEFEIGNQQQKQFNLGDL
jgi:hypothetical protein